MKPTDRLLDLIVFFLRTRGIVTFAQIKDAFPDDYEGNEAAVRRKWERDKADLLALGLPLTYVPPEEDDEQGEGGYRVDREQAYLPEVKLTPDEAAVLYLAGLSLVEEPSFPYRDALSIALAKMQLRVPSPSGSAEPTVQGRVLIDVAGRAADAEVPERLALLEDAVTRRKRVTFEYTTRYSGETARREVDAYGLFCRQGLWAVVGYAHERNAVRVFLVHRMRALGVNPARPGSPDFEVPAGFRLGDYSRVPAWGWELGEPVTVVLEAQEAFAWLAENELGQPGGPGADGWRRFSVEISNADALISWVLSMGPKVRLLEPAHLRARVKAQLESLLARLEPAP